MSTELSSFIGYIALFIGVLIGGIRLGIRIERRRMWNKIYDDHMRASEPKND